MNKLPLSIQNLVRLQDIKRWTVVSTTRQQSVAEHTCTVFFLTIEIATRLGVPFNSLQMAGIGMRAMLHDIDEIFTGDIPTPAKRRMNRKARNSLHVIADQQVASEQAKLIVKMADWIETTEFIYQYASGVHADQVVNKMMEEREIFMGGLPPLEREAMSSVIADLERGQRSW